MFLSRNAGRVQQSVKTDVEVLRRSRPREDKLPIGADLSQVGRCDFIQMNGHATMALCAVRRQLEPAIFQVYLFPAKFQERPPAELSIERDGQQRLPPYWRLHTWNSARLFHHHRREVGKFKKFLRNDPGLLPLRSRRLYPWRDRRNDPCPRLDCDSRAALPCPAEFAAVSVASERYSGRHSRDPAHPLHPLEAVPKPRQHFARNIL